MMMNDGSRNVWLVMAFIVLSALVACQQQQAPQQKAPSAPAAKAPASQPQQATSQNQQPPAAPAQNAPQAGSAPQPAGDGKTDTLVLGAYTVPKEAYEKEIIPAFQKQWQEKTGHELKVEQSYVGSGAQARAITGGFEADVAALSLSGDIDAITQAGLITNEWHNRKWRGTITYSVVVIGYRSGNPKNIKGWEDLTRDDVEVLYPNPKTSGGAQWCVNAIYGAALKKTEKEKGAPDAAAARELLKRVQKRVKVMDKSGRESVTTFERGIGDAIVTYENEAILRTIEGKEFPFLIPDATILIDNPVAIVDKYVDKHGSRAVAEAFVEFLHGDFAQRAFGRYGFRPANPDILKEFAERYPLPAMLFNIDYLGGWKGANEAIYGPEGAWTKVCQELAIE